MTRILLVDDDCTAISFQAKFLQGQGHEVVTANDGFEALALCAEFRPEVALLDVLMPGMSGIELAHKILELAPDPIPKLIAVTGYSRMEAAVGGDIFQTVLVKPIGLTELAAAVDRA